MKKGTVSKSLVAMAPTLLGGLFLCGCQPPIDLNVRLWTPADGSIVQNSAGFDLSVVVAQNAGQPTRLNRGEENLAKEIDGIAIGDEGLDVDAVYIEAVGNGAERIASGRTGPATIHADGTTSPEELVAILAPQGIVDLKTDQPTARNDATVCLGGHGRTYVFGGAHPETGALLEANALIDPLAREAVEIEGPPPQTFGACSVFADDNGDGTSTDTIWLAGGCDAADVAQGLRRSTDGGESFEVVDATPLTCKASTSVNGNRLWVLAGDVLQLRDANDGALIADATLATPRFNGALLALPQGAIVGGGYVDADENAFTAAPLDFVTESAGTLGFAAFGPGDIEQASFTLRDDGEAFALLVTATTAQIHRLQPAIASAPVQVENAPLTAGGFAPEQLIATADDGFLVLNEAESFGREFNRDGTTTDYPANAFGAQMVREPGGAVLIVGGGASGIKASVRALP